MPIDEDVVPGQSGHASHHNQLAMKANELDDLVTTGRLSEDELNTTIDGRVDEVVPSVVAEVAPRALGYTVAYLGDSKPTYGNGNASAGTYPDWVTFFSKGQAVRASVVSHPGWRTDQIAAVVATDIATIVASGARHVVLDTGTNDALQGTSAATFRTALRAILDALALAGLSATILTQPPLSGSITGWNNVQRVNWIIGREASARGLALVDIYGQLADPATGQAKASMNVTDNIHQAPAARTIVAKAIAAGLAGFLPPATNFLTLGVPMSMIPSPAFLTDTDGNGYANGIDGSAAGATLTPSLVADARGFNWQRMTLAGRTATTEAHSTTTITTGFSVGDRLAFSCLYRNGQSGRLNPTVICYSSAFAVLLQTNLSAAGGDAGVAHFDTDGVGYKEFIVPAGTANIVFQVVVGNTDGTYDFAMPTLVNLTTQGIA